MYLLLLLFEPRQFSHGIAIDGSILLTSHAIGIGARLNGIWIIIIFILILSFVPAYCSIICMALVKVTVVVPSGGKKKSYQATDE
jgi:hypothetical protein